MPFIYDLAISKCPDEYFALLCCRFKMPGLEKSNVLGSCVNFKAGHLRFIKLLKFRGTPFSQKKVFATLSACKTH
jgi:hypothetical protein